MSLVAKNTSVGYTGNQVVFSGISFTAEEGDMIALLGVNGIGKSTLLRTTAGLQNALTGTIMIEGREVGLLPPRERAKLISIVTTEKIFIDNITSKDFISLGRSPYTNWIGNLLAEDEEAIEKVISLMKIEKLAKKQFNQLSDGEKQKILIARALCQQTPVIILDEPTAFLDFRNKKEILQLLAAVSQNLKKTIILSTHDIETILMYCNKCWLMTEEKIFKEIKRSERFREEVMKELFPEELSN